MRPERLDLHHAKPAIIRGMHRHITPVKPAIPKVSTGLAATVAAEVHAGRWTLLTQLTDRF